MRVMYEIAPAIGYLVGQGLETVALNHISQSRQVAIAGHNNLDAVRDKPGVLSRSVASLALLGAATGFAFAEAAHNGNTVESRQPTLEVAVDQSFGTVLDGTSKPILNVAENVNDNNRIKVVSIAANNSGSQVESISTIKSNIPYGQPSIEGALSQALNIADSKLGVKTADKKTAGILVLTDGNSVGDPAAIKAEDNRNIPVYIVNFGKSDSTPTGQFSSITKETGGKLINESNNPAQVASELAREIHPVPTHTNTNGDRWPWLGLGVALSGITVRQYFRRRRETVA